MRNTIHKFGKFYSSIMINMIGIFIFTGVLSVVFGDHGWWPNADIYAISAFVYSYVIPILIAYTAGNQIGTVHEATDPDRRTTGVHHAGGAIAVLAVSGMILADKNSAILGAMILGPVCGYVWKHLLEPWTRKVVPGLEMLTRNLAAAVTGMGFALVAYIGLAPFIHALTQVLMMGVNALWERNLVCLVSLVIEPCKVFFLNNCINHGILLPLAIQQAGETGTSILFLLESNPGPGFGVLLALWLCQRKRRKEYAAYLFVEGIGGIHELYFPVVLSNLILLIPLIAGGMTGSFLFSVLGVTADGAISPGSILTVLLMTGRKAPLAVLCVAASALVSMGTACLILRVQEQKQGITQEEKVVEHKENLTIGFVCDAGVGSSAMGAGLFRRILREQGRKDISVEAYAVDEVPKDLSIAVCQSSFKELLEKENPGLEIHAMESLLSREEHLALIQTLQKEGKLS